MPAAQLDFLKKPVDADGNILPATNAERGATFRRVFTLYQGDPATSPRVNLSTVTKIKMQARRAPGREVVLECSTDNDCFEILDQADPDTEGQVVWTVSEALMEAVPGFKYFYDIKFWFSGGDAIRLVEGYWEVSEEITRDV